MKWPLVGLGHGAVQAAAQEGVRPGCLVLYGKRARSRFLQDVSPENLMPKQKLSILPKIIATVGSEDRQNVP